MFICNHCPFVKAVLDKIVRDAGRAEGARHRVGRDLQQRSRRLSRRFFRQHEDSRRAAALSVSVSVGRDRRRSRKAYGAVCTPGLLRLQRGAEAAIPRSPRRLGTLAEPRRARASSSTRWSRSRAPASGPAQQTARGRLLDQVAGRRLIAARAHVAWVERSNAGFHHVQPGLRSERGTRAAHRAPRRASRPSGCGRSREA